MTNHNMIDLQKWSHENFLKIPSDLRKEIHEILTGIIDEDLFDALLENYLNDRYIFDGRVTAHFDIGMSIRNAFRRKLHDDELPPVKHEDGQEYHNWDDYYIGAIADWLENFLYENIPGTYEMMYVIASPWNRMMSIFEPGNMKIHNNLILRGTLDSARDKLNQVKATNPETEEYKIYEISFMEIS